MKTNVFKTPEEIIPSLANYFVNCANEFINKQGKFSVALSGGNSPKKFYELLASADFKSKIDWKKVDFFFGDERYVPQDDPESNYLMAKTSLFDHLDIEDSQIYKVDTSLDPATAAQDYGRCICQYFDDKPSFDFVLLGLGDDAHTASIFPHTSLVWIDEENVKEVYLEDKQVYRISFTAPLINASKNVVFLTFGASKADAIKAVFEGEKNVDLYPAQLIDPENGELQWFVDEAAVSKLTEKP
ncbi:6-phosphogluconolactonase [Pedobacter psychrophilus]|uniref:6-phosphogluconolactonase n=1 Tax=Pedobacter psychrophilus TaxID=1826909 RepID=A0A179DE17_9SPHI|nr:6-phosphogluconolactonase [Pedobacter psychrophilus]OAQ39271.1 6-phosphogluconolactonase [Pedobacter psychrophilus]